MGFYDYKPKSSPINWKWGLDRLAKNHIDTGWWRNVSENFNLTQTHVRQYADYINWYLLSQNRRFPFDDNFLTEFQDKIQWTAYVANHRISEKTYRQFRDHISINIFLLHTYENKVKMVRKYFNQLQGHRAEYYFTPGAYALSQRDEIFCNITLPEKFLEENARDEGEWRQIAINQKLSKEFIEKHKDKLQFKDLMLNHKVYNKLKIWFPKEYEEFKNSRERYI